MSRATEGNGAALTHGAQAHQVGDGVRKVCCQCGRDLAGHRRYHDGAGLYWCLPCYQAAEKARATALVECQDCHKMISPQKVDCYGGRTLCGACARERALDRSRPHRERYREIYQEFERKRALHWAEGVGALVLSVMLLIWLRVL